MPQRTDAHPAAEELSDFGLGKLSEAAAVAIASHLESCPQCRSAVENQPPDSFVDKVRAAKPAEALARPETVTQIPGSTDSAMAGLPASTSAPDSLPAELRDHPKYRIVRELGRGGMGVVYQAVQTLMDRPVAIKVISPSVLEHPDALPRFQAEAKAAAKLDHANIVRAYDADQVGNLHLLVMEYVEGKTLANLVQQRGGLPIVHACNYIRQAALGLQHAFEQGMVHRDIKPGNLMLTPGGRVKVLDFGLARLRGGKSGGMTSTGAFMGTPEYVAPEQAMDPRKADIRADLYSLGCTLYYLLAGRPPFVEETPVQSIMAHIDREPPALSTLRQDVPAGLEALTARLLAKDPEQRFQKPSDLAQALLPFSKPAAKAPETPPAPRKVTAIQSGSPKLKGAGSTRMESARPRPARFRKKRPPWPRVVALAGGLLAVLLAGILIFWPTPRGLVKIESADPNVEIVFDKTGPTVKGTGKEPITLRAGEHGVLVKRGDFEFEAEKFVLKKGETVTLKVELLPGKIQLMADGRLIGVGIPPGEPPQKSVASKPATEQKAETPASVNTESAAKPAGGPDRTAAEWVLSIGGSVSIKKDDIERDIKAAGDLPGGAFALTGVNLEDNKKVDHAGLENCKGCKNLTVLILRRTSVTNPGLAPFRYCKNLETLDLLGTQVSDEGLAVFKDCKNLKHLDLQATLVSNDGLAYFKDCKNLASIDLSSTPLADAGLDLLAAFPKLAFANLKTTRVTEAGVKNLAAALPKCKIEWDIGSVVVQPSQRKTDPPPLDNADGFVSLFNGKDLTGWKWHPSQVGNWRVEHGILIGSGPSITSHLYTQRGDYKDFHLRIEARINEGGNSGVYFRTRFGPAQPAKQPRWLIGYNAKMDTSRLGGFLLDDPKMKVPLIRNREPIVPAGQWLTLEVLARGNHIIIKVNGEITADFTDEARRFSTGYIALQQHTPRTVVEFRKIEIKQLRADDSKAAGTPPQNAHLLFNGKDLSGWTSLRGTPPLWHVAHDYLEVAPRTGDIMTKEKFGPDFKLHVEFWLPLMADGKGQARANSGVYLQGRYEVQILDSYRNDTYWAGECAALYKLIPTAKNACKPPEQWQTYDITFHAPGVDSAGTVTRDGTIIVVHNGQTVIDNGSFSKVTGGALDDKMGEPGPIRLQEHASKVRYRKIWIQPLDGE
jgi:serine/threonine protein kinase